MQDHKELIALADQMALAVYRATKRWPREELYGLTSKVRRAAISVPGNLSEGCGGHTKRMARVFLDIAFESAEECAYQLSLAYGLGFIDEATWGRLKAQCNDVARRIGYLIMSLRARRS